MEINNKKLLLDLVSEQESLSLYLHIPFCSKKCGYCAFYSEEQSSWKGKTEDYVIRMEQEIRQVKAAYGKPFDTLFIGGGNPGFLSVSQLERLLDAAGKTNETTFEMNPETFTEEHLRLFEKGKVQRISMGIQSMEDETLKILGRKARRADNIRALNLLKKLPSSTRISLDLMEGLPSQDWAASQLDIDTVLSLSSPTHLSVYCLTLEEGTRLEREVKKGDVSIRQDDEMAPYLKKLWDYLATKGFEHYEISNFAMKGDECQHNLRYWHLEPYIGLGCTAASTLREKGHHLLRLQVNQTIDSYVNNNCFSGFEAEQLQKSEEIEEYLLVALRTKEGIDKKKFFNRFNLSLDPVIEAAHAIKPAWISNTSTRFSLSELGMLMSDTVILELSLVLDRIYPMC